jgi:hypothetical protein
VSGKDANACLSFLWFTIHVIESTRSEWKEQFLSSISSPFSTVVIPSTTSIWFFLSLLAVKLILSPSYKNRFFYSEVSKIVSTRFPTWKWKKIDGGCKENEQDEGWIHFFRCFKFLLIHYDLWWWLNASNSAVLLSLMLLRCLVYKSDE